MGMPKEQGPLLPDAPRVGWLPAQTKCDRCQKLVIARGGVFCGRSLDGSLNPQSLTSICWGSPIGALWNRVGQERGSNHSPRQ